MEKQNEIFKLDQSSISVDILTTQKFSSRFWYILDNDLELCPNCEDEYILKWEKCLCWLSNLILNKEIKEYILQKDKKNKEENPVIWNKSIKKIPKKDNKYEKINEKLIFKIQNVYQEQWKVKSIKFRYNKKTYIIDIKDYTPSDNKYELFPIKDLRYENSNVSRIVNKKKGAYYSMNYFKELWWFMVLNMYVIEVLKAIHNI